MKFNAFKTSKSQALVRVVATTADDVERGPPQGACAGRLRPGTVGFLVIIIYVFIKLPGEVPLAKRNPFFSSSFKGPTCTTWI